jgi:hypothetical protein
MQGWELVHRLDSKEGRLLDSHGVKRLTSVIEHKGLKFIEYESNGMLAYDIKAKMLELLGIISLEQCGSRHPHPYRAFPTTFPPGHPFEGILSRTFT